MKGIYFFRWILDQRLMRFMISSLTYRYNVRSSMSRFTLRPAAGVCGSSFRTFQPANKPTSKQTSTPTNSHEHTNKQQQRAATLINTSTSTTTMNSNPLGFSTHVGNLDRSYIIHVLTRTRIKQHQKVRKQTKVPPV